MIQILMALLTIPVILFGLPLSPGRAEMEGEHAHEHHHAQGVEAEEGAVEEFQIIGSSEEAEALGLEEVGNPACPLSGEAIDFDNPKHKPIRLAYQGKVYNFCCEMCIKDFKKDPEKFIRKIEADQQREEL